MAPQGVAPTVAGRRLGRRDSGRRAASRRPRSLPALAARPWGGGPAGGCRCGIPLRREHRGA
eukprot:8824851-Lingulodinium_polyedra.AAC.1